MSGEGGDDDGAAMMDSDDDNMIVVDEDDDVEMAGNDADESGAPATAPVTQVWDPSRYELDENEELDYDRSGHAIVFAARAVRWCWRARWTPDLGYVWHTRVSRRSRLD